MNIFKRTSLFSWLVAPLVLFSCAPSEGIQLNYEKYYEGKIFNAGRPIGTVFVLNKPTSIEEGVKMHVIVQKTGKTNILIIYKNGNKTLVPTTIR